MSPKTGKNRMVSQQESLVAIAISGARRWFLKKGSEAACWNAKKMEVGSTLSCGDRNEQGRNVGNSRK